MTALRVAIVDDEPLARDKLRGFLTRHPGCTLVGEAGDGLEAVQLLERTRPDLVLLDVQMPELDGFEVLGAADPLPDVIFVTAFDRYAIQAFEQGALDYLLKPVAPDRFDRALERAIARHGSADPAALARRVAALCEAVAPSRPRVERFLVRERDRSRLVPVGEVDWIEAAGNYVKLHARSGTHLVRSTLKDVEARLDPARFARIHRTAIVNLDRVRFLEPASHGDQAVLLEGGERLTLSRRYRDALPRILGDAP